MGILHAADTDRKTRTTPSTIILWKDGYMPAGGATGRPSRPFGEPGCNGIFGSLLVVAPQFVHRSTAPKQDIMGGADDLGATLNGFVDGFA
jgi:hypothetical protein